MDWITSIILGLSLVAFPSLLFLGFKHHTKAMDIDWSGVFLITVIALIIVLAITLFAAIGDVIKLFLFGLDADLALQ